MNNLLIKCTYLREGVAGDGRSLSLHKEGRIGDI